MNRQASLLSIRAIVAAAALAIGIIAVRVAAGEIISPRLVYFPSTPGEAAALYAFRDSTSTAAKVGIPRGDLWTAAAMTRAARLLFVLPGTALEPDAQADAEETRIMARRAAELSPHDPRIWLLLAAIDFRLKGSFAGIAEMLRLSYYTGPSVISLMPLRLMVAVQSDAISDDELQSLVPRDIQNIVMRRPNLKPAIALAYKDAEPKGREVIEATLVEADPNFLDSLTPPTR